MKLENIKKIRYGQNNLNCMVTLDYSHGNVYFEDFTKGIFIKVETQEKLDEILKNNKF